MTINPEQLMAAQIPTIEQHYDWRNCVMYALGLGVGLDPMDEADLPFVDETRLKVEPTMANVMGYPGFWQRELPLGLDWVRTVHGEQSVRIHKPLPAKASVRGVSRIVDLIDKGEGRGALIFVERDISDMASGELLATVSQTVFCRGDGGFGGVNKPQPAPHAVPARAPDAGIDLPTSPQSALIYRLSGDYNPLHFNPATAREAGFPRPILHGLATFGVAGHGLVKRWCDSDPTALRAMGGRFSSPVYPGETVRLDIWREGAGHGAFRASVPARGVVVIDNGHFESAA
jgi:acyl dehydratase